MKFRIVRVEMKDENTVLLYLKRAEKSGEILPKPDLSNPAGLIEFSMQMGMAMSKRLEELTGFDSIITLEYDRYVELDLKVGDIVEVEIRPVS